MYVCMYACMCNRNFVSHADIFVQRRLIVVVNKLDLVCHPDDDDSGSEEIGQKEVVDKVHKFIQEVCQTKNVPREVVIPLFGMWAYKARMLSREPRSEDRKSKVIKILSKFNSQPSGQGESPESVLGAASGKKLAKKLLQHTNLLQLEKR